MPTVTSRLPTFQTAVVAEGAGKLRILHDAPVPTLGPDTVLVQTKAVAINPVDAKMLDYSPVPGAVHGYDFAGFIVALGDEAPTHLQVGDRVAGFVHGMNANLPDVGAFAEYVAATGDLLLKIPDKMSFESGATIGLGLFTAGLGLFRELQVPAWLDPASPLGPSGLPDFVLVAGGATATGTRAIQLLKLAGLRPLASCSTSSIDLVKRFGAEQAFDYRDSNSASAIRAYTKNTLAYTLDCVSTAESMQLCYDAMGRPGGKYVALEPFQDAIAKSRPLTIEPSWLLALTIFGRQVDMHGQYAREANPGDREFGIRLTVAVQRLLDQGKIDPHPVRTKLGGWDGVIAGVDILRQQSMSGEKLVYPV